VLPIISILAVPLLSLVLTLWYGRPLRPHYQDVKAECPIVSVSCPASREPPIVFTASLNRAGANRTVKYCWTLSKSKIASGQGSEIITVDASSTETRGLTATVEVIGLPQSCANKASCSLSSH